MTTPINCTDSELATYLRGLEEGYLPTYYLGTNQSVQSKSTPIASKSYQQGKKTVHFRGFPSLMMCKHSTESRGEDLSMSSRVGFHARTSAQPEKGRESKESEAVCGQKWPESLAKYDPDSSSWRTRQCSLFEDLGECLETFPRWGIMQDGECWAQMPLGPVITGPESGYVPTPCASDHKGGAKNGRDSEFKHWLKRRHGKSYPHPLRVEEMMLWPIGWTDLKRLATAKFRKWLHSHGKYLQNP